MPEPLITVADRQQLDELRSRLGSSTDSPEGIALQQMERRITARLDRIERAIARLAAAPTQD